MSATERTDTEKNGSGTPKHLTNGGAGGPPALGGSEREFTAGDAV